MRGNLNCPKQKEICRNPNYGPEKIQEASHMKDIYLSSTYFFCFSFKILIVVKLT